VRSAESKKQDAINARDKTAGDLSKAQEGLKSTRGSSISRILARVLFNPSWAFERSPAVLSLALMASCFLKALEGKHEDLRAELKTFKSKISERDAEVGTLNIGSSTPKTQHAGCAARVGPSGAFRGGL
jgi:hypothetical protein